MTEIATGAERVEAPLKPLSLRANFTWTLVGNVVYAGCSWAMLVVLAKLGTPVIVGQFALGLAVTSPVIAFACLQLRAIQATDARREYLFRDYFGLRLIMIGIALVVICGIVLVSLYDLELAMTILVIGLGKAVDAISDVIYGALQQHEKMDRIAVSLVLKGILSLALLALGMVLTHSVLWASVGWAIASVIVVIAYDLRSGLVAIRHHNNDRIVPRFRPQLLRKISWLALPLGITMLLISLNSSIPRYFIQRYVGAAQLGIFAAMAYLIIVGNTFISALGETASPRLAKQYAKGDRKAFQRLLTGLVAIGVGVSAAGVCVAFLAGRPLLALLYGSEYAEQCNILVWLIVAAGISYVGQFVGYSLTAARFFKLQPIILAISVASCVLLSTFLIPSYGLRGAAWAIILADIIFLVLMSLYLLRAIRAVKLTAGT